MKRYLIIFLAFVMVVTTSAFSAFAETDAEAFLEETKIAVALGLLEDTATERTLENITRGEFFNAIAKLQGVETLNFDKCDFIDISTAHPYYESVRILTGMGYINGYGDGTIRPDSEISITNAVRLLCYVAGWKDVIDVSGNVATAASRSEICNYAEALNENSLSVGKAAKLLVKTGECMPVSPGTVGGDTEYVFDSETVFEKYMNINKVEGILKGSEFGYIDQNGSLDEGKVLISDLELSEGNSNAKKYLGYYTTAYYYGDDTDYPNTVLYAYASEKNNKVLRIKASDINCYNNNILSYYDDGNSEKENLRMDSVDVVYNGSWIPVPKNDDFDLDGGYIELIDNNKNNGWDVVAIENYETYVVDNVLFDDNKIYAKNGKILNVEELNPSSFTDEKGVQMHLVELGEWDVLSVAQNRRGDITRIIYALGVVAGKLESYGNSLDMKEVTIDGKPYLLSDYCQSNYGTEIEASLGLTATFGLDADGNIAFADFSSYKEERYGYIICWGVLNRVLEVKYMDEDGLVKIASLADKVKLNGESLKVKENLTLFQNISPQVMLFKLNGEGKINYIDTAYNTDLSGAVENLGEKETKENSLHMFYDCYSKDSTTGKPTEDTSNSKLYYYSSEQVFTQDGDVSTKGAALKYGVTLSCASNTKVFFVPSDENETDEEIYGLGKIADGDEETFFCKAYKKDSSQLTADLLLVYRGEASSDLDTNSVCAVVTKSIRYVVDEDDEVKAKISLFCEGKMVDYVTKDSTVLETLQSGEVPYSLKPGDVVQYSINYNDEITALKLIYSRGKDELESGGVSNADNAREIFRTRLLNTYYVNKTHMIATTTPLVSGQSYVMDHTFETRPISGYDIAVYDSETKEVVKGDSFSLIGFLNTGGQEWSRVFAQERYGGGRLMVIYK